MKAVHWLLKLPRAATGSLRYFAHLVCECASHCEPGVRRTPFIEPPSGPATSCIAFTHMSLPASRQTFSPVRSARSKRSGIATVA